MFFCLNTVAILALMLVTPTLQERILFCDFDVNNCGSDIPTPEDPDDGIHLKIAEKLEMGDKAFTDYTSISEMTLEGLKCDTSQQYFCTKDFKCRTSNSTEANCFKGKFIAVEYNSKKSKQITVDFPVQKFPQPRQYELSLKYFAECITDANTNCAGLHDFFEIDVRGKRKLISKEVYIDDALKSPGWQSLVLKFDTTERNQIVTLKIVNNFKEKSANMAYVYGIDNFLIEAVKQQTEMPTSTTTTTAPTTTTNTTTASQNSPQNPGTTASNPASQTVANATVTKPAATTTKPSSSSCLGPFPLLGMILVLLSASMTF